MTDRRFSLASLRHALSRRFLLKIKRATHRANAQLIVPEGRRVLVIAPHMDDEAIPCAGTLLQLIAAGAEVHVAFVSDSSAGLQDPALAAQLIGVRRAEARAVSDFLGFTQIHELGFPDSQLVRHEDAIATRLVETLAQTKPDLVLTPFPTDAHSDHMACASSVASAMQRARCDGTILAYEVWTPLWPNVAVNITAEAEKKSLAIRLYASQIADRDYAAAALGLNRYRGLAHAVEFAEAFYRCERHEYARISRMLDEV